MRKEIFGKAPSREQVANFQHSPNFRNGKFQNTIETPTYAPGYSLWGELRKQVFNSFPRRRPVDPIPSVKSDLKHLHDTDDVLVWFGHSSCFLKIDGKTILIDPVFSGNVSPVSGSAKSFDGSDNYTADDFPVIDILLISHDHYDHLDYETVLAIKEKTKKVICGLGVGSHFKHWGFNPDIIIEKDWHEKVVINNEFIIYTEPARHKSGRGINQNNTLWLSFVIQTPTMKIYYSGDGGYDNHFAETGKKFGPIDLAIMENGQYDSAWQFVHLLPHEVLQAAKDLNAVSVLPVHHSKFTLARHPWDEPIVKIMELNKACKIPLLTPMISEVVHLKDSTQTFREWWKDVR
jgi:L-ascorbate metabolism protein UlaG (beta-lactamase superfamily)